MFKKLSSLVVLVTVCQLNVQAANAMECPIDCFDVNPSTVALTNKQDKEIEKLVNQAILKANEGSIDQAIELFAKAGKLVEIK